MGHDERFWNMQARKFDTEVEKEDLCYLEILELTRKYLEPHHAVLDYGCGNGLYSLELAGEAKHFLGIDTSDRMVEVARDLAGKRGLPNLDFQCQDLLSNEMEKRVFDVVLAFNILHLIGERRMALARLMELMHPGGHLVTTTPCMGDRGRAVQGLLRLLGKLPIFPRVESVKAAVLVREMERAGFEIVEAGLAKHSSENHYIVARKAGP